MKFINLISSAILFTCCAQAGESSTPGIPATQENQNFDFCRRFKNFLTWYENKENPWIQEIKFSSRQQYQWGGTSAETFPGGRNWTSEWRRFRLGGEMNFLNRFKFYNVWNIGGLENRGSYDKTTQSWKSSQTEANIYELFLQYDQPNLFSATIGKIKSRMTAEYRTSSSKIRTVERSGLVNQLRAETSWGIQFNNPNKKDKFQWVAGLYSSTEDGDYGSYPDWQSGYLLLTASYDLPKIFLEKGRIWLDYTYTNQNMSAINREDEYNGMNAKNFWAISYEGSQDSWYVLSELMYGQNLAEQNVSGNQASNAFGFTFLPTYNFTPNIQGVFRYQFAQAPGGGLKLNSRYYQTLSPDTKYIERLNAFYFGVNFFLCEKEPDLAKIMLGAEYLTSSSAKSGQDAFNGMMYYIALRTNF